MFLSIYLVLLVTEYHLNLTIGNQIIKKNKLGFIFILKINYFYNQNVNRYL